MVVSSEMENFDLQLTQVTASLEGFEPSSVLGSSDMSLAAVAMILREREGRTEILMVRRAEHDRDPWSGHMAFPGGRVERHDSTTLAAATRETLEEIGLPLKTSATLVGRLSELQARSREGMLPLCIHPFVFALRGSVNLAPNYEIDETIWMPLGFFRDGRNRGSLRLSDPAGERVLPAYRFRGRVVWGLSLMMIDELVFDLDGLAVPPVRASS